MRTSRSEHGPISIHSPSETIGSYSHFLALDTQEVDLFHSHDTHGAKRAMWEIEVNKGDELAISFWLYFDDSSLRFDLGDQCYALWGKEHHQSCPVFARLTMKGQEESIQDESIIRKRLRKLDRYTIIVRSDACVLQSAFGGPPITLSRPSDKWKFFLRPGGFIGDVKLTKPGKKSELLNRESFGKDPGVGWDQQKIEVPVHSVAIVEELCISAFAGKHLPGSIVQSLSLAPGESMDISVNSYTKSNAEEESHRSILDSTSSTASQNFEDAVKQQHHASEGSDSNLNVHASVSGGGNWGFATVSAEAGTSYTVQNSRQQATERVVDALSKHATEASNQRQVEVRTTGRHSYEAGSESAVTRRFRNINVSRPLDITFRQVVQEVFSVVHVRAVRLGFVLDGVARQFPLEQLGGLLKLGIATERELTAIETYANELQHEPCESPWTIRQLAVGRVRSAVSSSAGNSESAIAKIRKLVGARNEVEYKREDGDPGVVMNVRGVVLACERHVMRTDAITCEVNLGEGAGLDEYSEKLQKAENSLRLARAEIEQQRAALCQRLVAAADKVESPEQLTGLAKAFSLINQPSISGEWALRPNGLSKVPDADDDSPEV